MISLKLILLSLLCVVDLSAHPGHSPLDSNAAHQLTHLEHWMPPLLIIAVCSVVHFIRRKKL